MQLPTTHPFIYFVPRRHYKNESLSMHYHVLDAGRIPCDAW